MAVNLPTRDWGHGLGCCSILRGHTVVGAGGSGWEDSVGIPQGLRHAQTQRSESEDAAPVSRGQRTEVPRRSRWGKRGVHPEFEQLGALT